MTAPAWPDKTINSLLEEQPQGFHFHQVIFNDNGEIANLKPVEASNEGQE